MDGFPPWPDVFWSRALMCDEIQMRPNSIRLSGEFDFIYKFYKT